MDNNNATVREDLLGQYTKTLSKISKDLSEMSVGLSHLHNNKEPNYKYVVNLIPEAETRKNIEGLQADLRRANSRIKELQAELNRVIANKTDELMTVKQAFGCGYLARSEGGEFEKEWDKYIKRRGKE